MLSTIVMLVLSFAMLGTLLGFAESFDTAMPDRQVLASDIADRNPAIQQKLFEDCIKDQRFDGELTQEEYDRCAYGIYG